LSPSAGDFVSHKKDAARMSSLPAPLLSHPKYRPDIDGLRAIAVLSVVFFHAFPRVLSGGYIGVDIFFVISGFLISTIIFENLERGSFSFAGFYARRIKRIFPALGLVLLACIGIGWFALLPDEYRQLGRHLWGGAAFLSNFILWREAGYFDVGADTKPLLHLWSLGIEEQFYIVFPCLVWLTWKLRLNPLTVTLVLALTSFVLNLKGIDQDATATFYAPYTRFWELLGGGLLAWHTLHPSRVLNRLTGGLDRGLGRLLCRPAPPADGRLLANLAAGLGLLLVIYGVIRLNTRHTAFPGHWALVPVVGAWLLIAAGPHAWINRRLLSNKAMVWFGLISFPLYLWHWPLLSFARIMQSETPSVTIRLGAVLLAILLAWLTYRLIERRVRAEGNTRVKVAVLVVLMIAIGVAGYAIERRAGFPERFHFSANEKELTALLQNPLPPVDSVECGKLIPLLSRITFNGGCVLSKNTLPRIAFMGDSHTLHYKNAIWRNFQEDSVLMAAQMPCFPVAVDEFFTIGACEERFDLMRRYLETSTTVDTVVVSGYWAYLMSGGFQTTGETWRIPKPLTQTAVDSFKKNASRFFATLLGAGKRVILLRDIPDLDFNVATCFDFRPLTLSKANLHLDCSIPRLAYLQRMQPYDAVIDDVLKKFPQVVVFDPRPLFCQGERCKASDGALPYYFNGDHVNRHGAEMVIQALRREVKF
jgi:peptidoglycan/LPS O-acetylase OafA/YrhL